MAQAINKKSGTGGTFTEQDEKVQKLDIYVSVFIGEQGLKMLLLFTLIRHFKVMKNETPLTGKFLVILQSFFACKAMRKVDGM